MSEKMRVVYYALWIAHPVLQIGIATIMLRRGLHRKFKFFFGYILTQLATFAVVFPAAWHSYSALFYLYWACDALSVAFGFAVIHEVFLDVFDCSIPCAIWAACCSSGRAWSCCW